MFIYGQIFRLYPVPASFQVDLALACNIALASYLQAVWNGTPLRPPPVDRRDSNTRWANRNPGYRGNLDV